VNTIGRVLRTLFDRPPLAGQFLSLNRHRKETELPLAYYYTILYNSYVSNTERR
jgi:hypothetical protein